MKDGDEKEGVLYFMKPSRVTTIGTWNVRTLYTAGALGMLIHELESFRWDIIGIAETHWTEVQEISYQDYKILSSGKPDEHRAGIVLY